MHFIRVLASDKMSAMRLVFTALGVLLLAGCVVAEEKMEPTPVSVPAENEEYRLAAGDVISIRVFGEDDLRFDRIRLNEVSSLTFPFGDVQVHGRTTREVEAAITQTLQGRLLLKPRVWVNVEEYRPFFIQGQVGRPGAFPYQPGLNVSRAIIVAGGFTVRAAKNRIFLVRDKDNAQTRIRVDGGAAVRPGDTVIVEESFF